MGRGVLEVFFMLEIVACEVECLKFFLGGCVVCAKVSFSSRSYSFIRTLEEFNTELIIDIPEWKKEKPEKDGVWSGVGDAQDRRRTRRRRWGASQGRLRGTRGRDATAQARQRPHYAHIGDLRILIEYCARRRAVEGAWER